MNHPLPMAQAATTARPPPIVSTRAGVAMPHRSVAAPATQPVEASSGTQTWPERGSPPAVYTDPGFLQLLARVYFPRRSCQVLDCAIGNEVFRLLTVRGHGPVTSQTFIDFHEPLRELSADEARQGALPRGPRLAFAVRGLLDVGSFTRLSQPAPPPWLQGGAPAVLWRDFPDWDSYLGLLRRRHALAEDQRRGRRLAQAVGPLTFTPDDLSSDVLPTCMAWKSARDLEARRPALFAEPAHRAFFHQLRLRGLLHASTLRDGDGGLLAVWLGAVHHERWSGWVFAFKPDAAIARFSPGRQLLHAMLRHSHTQGHREFDFSIGLEPYKLGFATHVRPLGPAGPPTLRQQLGAAVRRVLGR